MPDLPFTEKMKANESAWDEVTPIHQKHRKDQAAFFRNGGISIHKKLREHLPALEGRRIAHLCCNCGQDTLSLVNMGARCTGFDFSEKAVREARKLSDESGVVAEFVKANVLDLPPEYGSAFDMVFISEGVLVWMPDIALLLKNAAMLLKQGGELILFDQHPFTLTLEEDGAELAVRHDYFEKEPEQWAGLDYVGNTTYDAKPNYQFMVRFSDLIRGMSEGGLVPLELREFDYSFFQQFPGLERAEDGTFRYPERMKRVPLTMLLRARRHGPVQPENSTL